MFASRELWTDCSIEAQTAEGDTDNRLTRYSLDAAALRGDGCLDCLPQRLQQASDVAGHSLKLGHHSTPPYSAIMTSRNLRRGNI